ncbi:TPA_exp: hypothetical protein A8136_5330 [Trichophyton benhamiae CBS 112371]|nr:TPA_exp: hypothetical protein A8136_5330 [Trichophyton benhamiae CBS 112371]
MDTPQAQHEKREATQDEVANLQHVADSVPAVVWVALVAGAAERFTFYAATTPWPLFVTSLPYVTNDSIKIAGLVISMVFLGLGTGGVRATVSPFIGDQYTVLTPQLVVTKQGKSFVTDRTLTLQYIYNVFYWFTNIASLSLIASTYLEKEVGFWAAYLLPLSTVWMLIPLMLFWQKEFDAAKPAYQAATYGREVEWTDQFVSEMKKGLIACKVIQLTNNLISQAGQTRLGGIPNDTIQALNSIACVLLGPLIQKILYPALQRYGIAFKPIARMTSAFVIMSTAMAFTAGLQKLIYTRGPCYDQPLSCPDSKDGRIPNDISVWTQTPVYFLLAGAEILGFATLSEYSYSKSPQDMRSLVQALRQVTAGIGSAVGIATSPLAANPRILYLYTGLAVVMIVTAPVFWLIFRGYDKIDEELDCIESAQPANNGHTGDTAHSVRP